MKSISPVITTLILIAIAVIAGVFVLRQFIILSSSASHQNALQIQDAVLYRVVKYISSNNSYRTEVTLQISVKNIGQRVIKIKDIIVDSINITSFKEILLSPGQIYTGSYVVFNKQGYYPDWDIGTEHIITVYYQVLGQPGVQKVSAKVPVQ